MILDNENGKKHIERIALDYFVDAYGGKKLGTLSLSKNSKILCDNYFI